MLCHVLLQVFLSDIAFFTAEEDELKFLEEKGIYPPRFNIVSGCSPTVKQSKLHIKFKGSDLKYDIIVLNPQHIHGNAPLPSKLTIHPYLAFTWNYHLPKERLRMCVYMPSLLCVL